MLFTEFGRCSLEDTVLSRKEIEALQVGSLEATLRLNTGNSVQADIDFFKI